MTLQELYEKTGGDYESALGRFRDETRVRRFALMFLQDGTMAQLKHAVACDDRERAFHMAHTLKGLALNMSFDRLAASSSALTEQLRSGDAPADEALYAAVAADHGALVEALEQLA